MLVYLDSGDLANLERFAARRPADFADLLEGWKARECILALSLHHAQEIAQLSDDESRRRRLAFLERFPRVQYEAGGSHKVFEMETMAQLFAAILGHVPDYDRFVRPGLFREEGLASLVITVLELGAHLRKLEGAQDLTAEARNTTRGIRTPHSFRRQRREIMNIAAARASMDELLASEGLTKEVRAMMELMFGAISANLDASSNLRVALEKAYGIEGYQCMSLVDDEDLARVATFFACAKESASEYGPMLGVPVERCLQIVPLLDPYDCPGLRIEMAVSRAQDASNQAADGSDEPDRAHTAFIPYVDAAFADRRTVGFYAQEARSGRRNAALLANAGKLCKSGPPERLLLAIDGIMRNAA